MPAPRGERERERDRWRPPIGVGDTSLCRRAAYGLESILVLLECSKNVPKLFSLFSVFLLHDAVLMVEDSSAATHADNQSNVLLLTSASVLAMDDPVVRRSVATLAQLSTENDAHRALSPPRAHAIHVMTSAIDAIPRRRITSTAYDAVVVVPEPVGNLGFAPTSPAAFDGLVRSAARLVKDGGWMVSILGASDRPASGGDQGQAGWSTPEGQGAHLKSMMVMLGFRGVDVRDGVVCGYRAASKAADRISVIKLDVAETTGAIKTRGPVWTVGADDEDDGEDDLIDEEELLGEEYGVNAANGDAQRIEAEKAGCGVAGSKAPKKACANCTCGLAEGKVTKLTKDMIENPQSGGCGSCSLGDAFRCAGCPYRGLPAFKLGEKIALPNDFLTDDIE